MNDITRQTIIMFSCLILSTGLGFLFVWLSEVNLKQWFLCCIAVAFFHPVSSFVSGFIMELIKKQ